MTTLRPDFLWGAATAAHQIEGDNYNSDFWAAERSGSGHLQEPSGSACDSWHRYREDIRLLAEAGLTTYRFSIEWARIEPVLMMPAPKSPPLVKAKLVMIWSA